MRKISVSLLFLLIVGLSVRVSAQQTRCAELIQECQILEGKIKNTSKSSEKFKLYKELVKYMCERQQLNCTGNEKQKIDSLNRIIASIEGNTVFTQKYQTCEADSGYIYIGLKTDKYTLLSNPSWTDSEVSDRSKALKLYVGRNTLPHDRRDTIVVRNESKKKTELAILTQRAATLRLNMTSRVGFSQDGGQGRIFIETNDTAWSAKSSENWVTATVTQEGVMLNCTSNPTKKKRTATITVKFACGTVQKVPVTQVIGRTRLEVPSKYEEFESTGGSKNVQVNCNYDQWSATSNQSWLTITRNIGGIKIDCKQNTHAENRMAIVKVVTEDEERLEEMIQVIQLPSAPYLEIEGKNELYSDGMARTIYVPVNTNVADWSVKCTSGNSWSRVSRSEDGRVKVNLSRNDDNSSRTSSYTVEGKGLSKRFTVYQPNRGYAGRYEDYFDANGTWRLTWFSIDFHAATAVGDNISVCNIRWKPVEASLLNFNLDYVMCGFSANWEPLVRGFVPISRDGRWAGFLGMGAHVCMTGQEDHHFLIEFGVEANWNERMSSHMFFKYNGGVAFGISFDIGRWWY